MGNGDNSSAMATEPLFIGSDIYRGSSYGRQHPLAIPRVSTVIDLARALGLSRIELYTAHDRPLDEPELAACRELIRRRDGQPAQTTAQQGIWHQMPPPDQYESQSGHVANRRQTGRERRTNMSQRNHESEVQNKVQSHASHADLNWHGSIAARKERLLLELVELDDRYEAGDLEEAEYRRLRRVRKNDLVVTLRKLGTPDEAAVIVTLSAVLAPPEGPGSALATMVGAVPNFSQVTSSKASDCTIRF